MGTYPESVEEWVYQQVGKEGAPYLTSELHATDSYSQRQIFFTCLTTSDTIKL